MVFVACGAILCGVYASRSEKARLRTHAIPTLDREALTFMPRSSRIPNSVGCGPPQILFLQAARPQLFAEGVRSPPDLNQRLVARPVAERRRFSLSFLPVHADRSRRSDLTRQDSG